MPNPKGTVPFMGQFDTEISYIKPNKGNVCSASGRDKIYNKMISATKILTLPSLMGQNKWKSEVSAIKKNLLLFKQNPIIYLIKDKFIIPLVNFLIVSLYLILPDEN